jgi:UDP-N-acetylglucosamine 4,6-dehydratase/5-epimerase
MKNSRIMIFGGTGSLGKTLIKRYTSNNKVSVFSRDESKHWTIRNEMGHENLSFYVGDIRDKQRCLDAILNFQPTHIILASALKHVDVCERTPAESIKTNITGIENVVNVIKENHQKLSELDTVLMVSTDKACSPINVYGMCKSIAERVVTSVSDLGLDTKFIAVRYGNVLESRGSIIPLFKYQSEHKKEITVTDERMTRYVMTLNESVDLIDTAMKKANTGETWIPNLPSMKVMDLAEIFSSISGKPIKVIGMRPGEKIHEDLINEAESMRAVPKGDYYAICSSFTPPFQSKDCVMKSDMSLMSKKDLSARLKELRILEKNIDQFLGKTIEEIKK